LKSPFLPEGQNKNNPPHDQTNPPTNHPKKLHGLRSSPFVRPVCARYPATAWSNNLRSSTPPPPGVVPKRPTTPIPPEQRFFSVPPLNVLKDTPGSGPEFHVFCILLPPPPRRAWPGFGTTATPGPTLNPGSVINHLLPKTPFVPPPFMVTLHPHPPLSIRDFST